MLVCKSLAPARSGLGGWLGLGFALVVLSGAPVQSFADSARSSGGSGGGGDSYGRGSARTRFDAGTTSRASDHDGLIFAETFSEGEVASRERSRRGSSRAKVKTYASAFAGKHKQTLTALAVAGVTVEAEAADGSGQALVLSSSGSLAYARSGKTLSAYALSGTGASAHAETDGKVVYTTSSIPGGTTATFQKGRSSYSIAYTDTGAFAMAVSSRKAVSAMTGTTTQAGALASGDLRAFLRSSTFASAYASPGMASAYAESSGYGRAERKFGGSSAFSTSWASATVKSGKAKVLTSSGSKNCKSVQSLKKVKVARHCNIEF